MKYHTSLMSWVLNGSMEKLTKILARRTANKQSNKGTYLTIKCRIFKIIADYMEYRENHGVKSTEG